MTALEALGLKKPDDCGKRGYPSRSAAKKARQRSRHDVRPYLCPDCAMWHLGHLGKTVIGGFQSRQERFAR